MAFIESCEESNEKVNRMYTEVRYAKMCSGIGDNKAFFRLRQSDGKRLSSEMYGDGLIKYFEGTNKTNMITIADLKNVLSGLEGRKVTLISIQCWTYVQSNLVYPLGYTLTLIFMLLFPLTYFDTW